jgi:hypothetical protein
MRHASKDTARYAVAILLLGLGVLGAVETLRINDDWSGARRMPVVVTVALLGLGAGHLRAGSTVRSRMWPRWLDDTRSDLMVPIVREPEEILVICGGGAGRHSAWVPGWGNVDRTRAVTRTIARSPRQEVKDP